LCRACGRQFTPNATKKIISDETKRCIDKLLLEKLSLAGSARTMEVAETWLQGYVNQKYKQVEQQAIVVEKKGASYRMRRVVVICRQ